MVYDMTLIMTIKTMTAHRVKPYESGQIKCNCSGDLTSKTRYSYSLFLLAISDEAIHDDIRDTSVMSTGTRYGNH